MLEDADGIGQLESPAYQVGLATRPPHPGRDGNGDAQDGEPAREGGRCGSAGLPPAPKIDDLPGCSAPVLLLFPPTPLGDRDRAPVAFVLRIFKKRLQRGARRRDLVLFLDPDRARSVRLEVGFGVDALGSQIGEEATGVFGLFQLADAPHDGF